MRSSLLVPMLLFGCAPNDPLEVLQTRSPPALDVETEHCPPADHPDVRYLYDRQGWRCGLTDFFCPEGFWWFDAPQECGCGCARLGSYWDSSR